MPFCFLLYKNCPKVNRIESKRERKRIPFILRLMGRLNTLNTNCIFKAELNLRTREWEHKLNGNFIAVTL